MENGNYQKILSYALSLAAKREYSTRNIQNKLNIYCAKHSISCELVNKIIKELIAKNIVSDERFAAALVSSYAEKKGNKFIDLELRKHGISDEHIEPLIQNLDSEFSRAKKILNARFSQKPRDQKEFNKQFNYLNYRGFDSQVVLKLLEKGGKNDR